MCGIKRITGWRIPLVVASLMVVTLGSGCVTLTPTQQAKLREVKSAGLVEDQVQKKNAVAAGLLNLLPGVGNFYLAVGTDEWPQWILGGVDLVLWPYSALWAVPQGFVDGVNVNKKATADYYAKDPKGVQELAAAKSAQEAQLAAGKVPKAATTMPSASVQQ